MLFLRSYGCIGTGTSGRVENYSFAVFAFTSIVFHGECCRVEYYIIVIIIQRCQYPDYVGRTRNYNTKQLLFNVKQRLFVTFQLG